MTSTAAAPANAVRGRSQFSIESPEPFNVGKQDVGKFRKEAGNLKCKAITGMSFSTFDEFQKYVQSSKKCAQLIKLAVNEASKQIDTYKPMIH